MLVDYKKNSLNTFRLLAAIQVLWIHALTHLELQNIPVIGAFIAFFSGVPIFFTLSGFLIWHSIGRSHSFSDYAKKRFWRIYPELWVAVALEIIVLLILYSQPVDWPKMALFVFGQATIFQFWTPDFLRGYGCGCPNGALWTIAILIQFYFLSFFVYKWMKGRSMAVWGGVLLASILIEVFGPTIRHFLPGIIGKLYGVTLIPYIWMFMISSFAAEFKDTILPVLKKYWWIFAIILITNRTVGPVDIKMNTYYALFDTILLFCALVGFAYQFPNLNIRTDISYGVYIYHMTVMNAFISLGFKGENWTIWGVVGLSCLLAWISTRTIGQITAKKKEKFAFYQN